MAEPAATGTTDLFVWSGWEFRDRHELLVALRQYTANLDGTKVRKYGDPDLEPMRPGGGASGGQGTYEHCLMQKRSTIDAGMYELEQHSGLLWLILDSYYRQGLSLHPRGWLVVAQAARIRQRIPCMGLSVRCTVDTRGEFTDARKVDACPLGDAYQCQLYYDLWRGILAKAVDGLWGVICPR